LGRNDLVHVLNWRRRRDWRDWLTQLAGSVSHPGATAWTTRANCGVTCL